MTENPNPPATQEVAVLNLRINDMMTQLNTVLKALIDENTALQKENAELKAKPKETQKTK